MAQEYLEMKIENLPRLPLEGKIDLTYRCNNNCRHCWSRIPPDFEESGIELSSAEIKKIADEARKMGCRRWLISGGEPMLRPDFAEIFDYLTTYGNSYTINTNGTSIIPKIAKLMKRKGTKMVALYGATAEIHDHITRNPGSFEAAMRGFNYLQEAGAGFIVQIIPMKDNYHQLQKMVKLAGSLSRHYRIGAAWLYLSARGDKEKDAEIIRQRLSPKEVIAVDKPNLSYEERPSKGAGAGCQNSDDNGYLFSTCIGNKRDFHIDPYGKITFCRFINEPDLRYDLRRGNLRDYWENFTPSLARTVEAAKEYQKNCGSCALKKDCRICPVFAYLEHRDFNKKVEYLCAVAAETREYKDSRLKDRRRYYRIADITIQVDSELPITDATFHPKFKLFEADGPGEDTVVIKHHFSLPDLDGKDLGKEVYRRPLWAIYKKYNSWIYLGIPPDGAGTKLQRVMVFNADHTRGRIYNDGDAAFFKGGRTALTLAITDQIFLARLLAERKGFYLHVCGANFEGKGLLFAGDSGAGKSTMAMMLKGKAEILCDDRVIVRSLDEGFKIYGTWSHGDVPDISANSVLLKAIMFLEKADENCLIHLEDKREIIKMLLASLVKPLVTVDWWEKALVLIEKISEEIPCYRLRFDKSGRVVDVLRKIMD